MANSEGIVGHHLLPVAVARAFKDIIEDALPGWAVNGEHNFKATASTQKATVQLGDTIMHNGGHSWLNKALNELLMGIDDAVEHPTIPGRFLTRTEKLSALNNYLREASDPTNFLPDSKTGGYVSYLSKRDPLLIINENILPDTDYLNQYHSDNLKWDKIVGSGAGQQALSLKPRLVNKKLVFDGTIDGDGFFSRPSDKIDTFEKLTSTEFSRKYAVDNDIKLQADKSITGNSDAVKFNKTYADEFVDREVNGVKISKIGTLPNKILNTLQKAFDGVSKIPGIDKVLILAILTPVALSASDAQASEGYDSNQANAANRNFVAELIGETFGAISGIVSGALAGLVSFGLAAIPVAIAVAEAGTAFGKYLGGLFYDSFVGAGNALAESVAPIFGSIADSATDLAAVIYNSAAEVAETLSDFIFGLDGLFGLEGPLFGEGGPLQIASQFFFDQALLPDSGEWFYDGFDAIIEGTDRDDLLIHDGFGEAYGGAGDDILVGFRPQFIAQGDALFDTENSPLASEEQRLTLDGGEGDDWVITFGGTGAITIGGEGRDFIFNTSAFGQIYGDTIDGLDSEGNELNHEGLENSDVFWFWPGTFIQDAQPNDILQMFGIPLTGGTNAAAGLVRVGDGSLAVDFFNWVTFYGVTNSGQLLVINTIANLLGIGPGGDFPDGVQVVEDYDFGGFSDENYGRAAAGDLGLTFRIFLPRDRADEGVTISLFNAVWGSVFTYIDVGFNLAKLLCFVFIPPQNSRKYCY